MKLKILSLLAISLFGMNNIIGRAKIPIPYGEKEKIVKIVDLPDTEEFQLEDGRFFDIGIKYTISHIVWLPYSNTEPIVTGYVDDETFVELTEEEIKQIASFAKVEIPNDASASFFDRIGGKIILGILLLIVVYGIYSSYFGKKEDEKNT